MSETKSMVTIDGRAVEIVPGHTIFQYLKSRDLIDPTADNPYAFENMVCEYPDGISAWAFADGLNPRYVKGFCAAPAINLDAACFVYTLDLRGNYWGASLTPAQIVKLFEDDKSCGADVLSWTDSDCGGDPDACDWSNTAW